MRLGDQVLRQEQCIMGTIKKIETKKRSWL